MTPDRSNRAELVSECTTRAYADDAVRVDVRGRCVQEYMSYIEDVSTDYGMSLNDRRMESGTDIKHKGSVSRWPRRFGSGAQNRNCTSSFRFTPMEWAHASALWHHPRAADEAETA